MTRPAALLISYIITLFYMGFSTITVFSMYPADALFGDWVFWGALLTLPVSALSIGVRFADPDAVFFVCLIQLVVSVLMGWLIYRWYFKRIVNSGM